VSLGSLFESGRFDPMADFLTTDCTDFTDERMNGAKHHPCSPCNLWLKIFILACPQVFSAMRSFKSGLLPVSPGPVVVRVETASHYGISAPRGAFGG
jgi:hypothetical protein